MLTPAQLTAREGFDLVAAMACLPRSQPPGPPKGRGHAGRRLAARLTHCIADDKLRAFARGVLGAQRTPQQYLDALRIVLGNIGHAGRHGYRLELNVRTTVAPERTMRTIIGQLREAGITYGHPADLGQGRRQVVQCFGSLRSPCAEEDAPAELERIHRQAEAEAGHPAPALPPRSPPAGLEDHEVPF